MINRPANDLLMFLKIILVTLKYDQLVANEQFSLANDQLMIS